MTSAYELWEIPPIEVHHRLRIAREWANLEQSELAERMGISRQAVGSAERGASKPRKITLNAWALATGVPVHWLETGQQNAPAGPDGPGEGMTGGAPSRARTEDLRIISPSMDRFSVQPLRRVA